MDWTSLGLSRDPFERSPELDDACLPNKISALLAELQSSLRSPQGVSVLVAKAAAGKSIAASAFSRRIASKGEVAFLAQPASSVSSIAREALSRLDPEAFNFTMDDDWGATLRSSVERRAVSGGFTAIVIDDAHRLSPQTLEDLAGLFGDDEDLRLHIFLFGRPRLLDRMQAGADRALDSHLLQVARLDPLGVRDSVRYLERRLAICGGELAVFYNDDAIDEIVQKAAGRLRALEEVASEALRRAIRRGARRASAEDVMGIAVLAIAEEDEVMASRQQPLKFSLVDEDDGVEEAGAVEWGDEEDEEAPVEWGEDEEGSNEEWGVEEERGIDAELPWDASPIHLTEAPEEEDDAGFTAFSRFHVATADAEGTSRRRMMGPAVLSIGACLGLVWAANHVPGPAADSRHGRDTMLFAQPVANAPREIMRLASTAEAADADSQVVAWRAQPTKPVSRDVLAVSPMTVATAESKAPALSPVGAPPMGHSSVPATTPVSVSLDPRRAATVIPETTVSLPHGASPSSNMGKTVRPSTATETAKAKPDTRKPARAKAALDPVYTVQLGAFKARRNAEVLVSKLRGKPTRILLEGGFYRVMSGAFDSKREASLHEASLKRAGYTTFVRTAAF